MKRAFIAAVAATGLFVGMSATSAQATPEQEAALRDSYTRFQENALDLLQQGRFPEAQQAFDTILAPNYKGHHELSLSIGGSGSGIDVSAMMGHPNNIVFENPRVSFSVDANTTRPGFLNAIGLTGAGIQSVQDKNMALLVMLAFQNADLHSNVSAIEIDDANKTATLTSTLSGTVDTDAMMNQMGGKPPLLDTIGLQVSMECVSVLKLDDDGGYKVLLDDCTGGATMDIRTKPPQTAPTFVPFPIPSGPNP